MLRTRSRLARAVRRTRAKNAQAGTGRPGHADLRTAGWHRPSWERRFKNRRLRRVISGTRLLEHLRLRRLITSRRSRQHCLSPHQRWSCREALPSHFGQLHSTTSTASMCSAGRGLFYCWGSSCHGACQAPSMNSWMCGVTLCCQCCCHSFKFV